MKPGFIGFHDTLWKHCLTIANFVWQALGWNFTRTRTHTRARAHTQGWNFTRARTYKFLVSIKDSTKYIPLILIKKKKKLRSLKGFQCFHFEICETPKARGGPWPTTYEISWKPSFTRLQETRHQNCQNETWVSWGSRFHLGFHGTKHTRPITVEAASCKELGANSKSIDTEIKIIAPKTVISRSLPNLEWCPIARRERLIFCNNQNNCWMGKFYMMLNDHDLT